MVSEEKGAAVTVDGYGMVERHVRDKRILLVDDEAELAGMVAAILHGAGFSAVDRWGAARRRSRPSTRAPPRPRTLTSCSYWTS